MVLLLLPMPMITGWSLWLQQMMVDRAALARWKYRQAWMTGVKMAALSINLLIDVLITPLEEIHFIWNPNDNSWIGNDKSVMEQA